MAAFRRGAHGHFKELPGRNPQKAREACWGRARATALRDSRRAVHAVQGRLYILSSVYSCVHDQVILNLKDSEDVF